MALAARKKTPKVSLGWLVATSFGLDLLWPVLLVAGVERVSIVPGITAANSLSFDYYPWSHSLLMAVVWGLLVFAFARWRRVPRTSAWILGGLVVSHWVLDLIVHRPDLPLWPGSSPLVGLGLWNSVPWSLGVEGALFILGIGIYLRTRPPADRVGKLAFWSWIGAMTLMWLPGPFSAPPPSARAVAWVSLGMWLLPFWAAWADRHAAPATVPAPAAPATAG